MLRFRVNHGSWQAGDYGPYTDTVEISNPAAELTRVASHAHAAGAITVTQGLKAGQVQSQAAGEKAYAKALRDGTWHEGQLLQHELEESRP